MRIQVDDGSVQEGGGKGSQSSADISDPLYAGGLPGTFICFERGYVTLFGIFLRN